MDFDSYYADKEAADILEKQAAEQAYRARNRQVALEQYYQCMEDLASDIPRLLDMYASDPPSKYGHVEIDGEKVLVWSISDVPDSEHVYTAHLLASGQIAITHSKSKWHDAYEPAINEEGIEYQKWIWSGWHRSYDEEYWETLDPNSSTDPEDIVLEYLPALVSSSSVVKYQLGGPERARQAKMEEEAVAKSEAVEKARQDEIAKKQQAAKDKKKTLQAAAIRRNILPTWRRALNGVARGIFIGLFGILLILPTAFFLGIVFYNFPPFAPYVDNFGLLMKTSAFISVGGAFLTGYIQAYQIRTRKDMHRLFEL